MSRLLLGAGVVLLLGLAVAIGGRVANRPVIAQSTAVVSAKAPVAGAVPSPISIKVEEKNPWTSLDVNVQNDSFQFLVVTDRTGGRRPGVFGKAVEKINLMQPEFVVSVGDLIEGYTEDPGVIALEWSEFQSHLDKLKMPFFMVAGNHDLANPKMKETWDRKFGRTYYHFVYKNVLFLCLNTEDPPNSKPFAMGPEQQQWAIQTLGQYPNVRHTFVFLHKPVWTYVDFDPRTTGWGPIEDALQGRPYTVLAGHNHVYARYVRHGRDYIMLATTGGGSKLRGIEAGEFDQVLWITMKGNEPILANLVLDGILEKEFRTLPEPKRGAKPQAAE